MFNKIYYYQWQVQLVPDKQQVPDMWRDACKLLKFIKFGVKGLQNISDRLYIMVYARYKIYYYY